VIAERLFGAHVSQCSQQIAGARQPAVGLKLRETEIGNPNLAKAIEQQVAGLDVAMNDSELMCMRKCRGSLLNSEGKNGITSAILCWRRSEKLGTIVSSAYRATNWQPAISLFWGNLKIDRGRNLEGMFVDVDSSERQPTP
jgi:hypothetical protein